MSTSRGRTTELGQPHILELPPAVAKSDMDISELVWSHLHNIGSREKKKASCKKKNYVKYSIYFFKYYIFLQEHIFILNCIEKVWNKGKVVITVVTSEEEVGQRSGAWMLITIDVSPPCTIFLFTQINNNSSNNNNNANLKIVLPICQTLFWVLFTC